MDEEENEDLRMPGESAAHLSEQTVIEYQKVFRDLISDYMMDKNSGDYMVGGPGCTIEIDESQYGLWNLCKDFIFFNFFFFRKTKVSSWFDRK